MGQIKTIIADNNYLTRKGLVSLVGETSDFVVVSEAETSNDLLEMVKIYKPKVVIIDYSSAEFKLETLVVLNKKYPQVKLLAITPELSASTMAKALESGVISYVLKDCEKEEITEALEKTAESQRFLCGKIVTSLMTNKKVNAEPMGKSRLCEGFNVTDRELEVIKLIAEGYSNKEMADRLFLSTHTVTTHRKNIMSKLGVNNTAGLVMFAVRENLLTNNNLIFS